MAMTKEGLDVEAKCRPRRASGDTAFRSLKYRKLIQGLGFREGNHLTPKLPIP